MRSLTAPTLQALLALVAVLALSAPLSPMAPVAPTARAAPAAPARAEARPRSRDAVRTPPSPRPRAAAVATPRSHDDFAALHEQLGHADPAVRRAACEAIGEASPDQRALHLARLQRHSFRRHTEHQRLLFVRAGVELPGPSGWFNVPKLKPGERAPWTTDMLKAVLPRPVPMDAKRRGAHVRALETLCVIRALGRMKDLRVAEPLVRFSFTPYGVTFRWEVIRAIRSLGGYAVPALLKLSRLKVWSYKKQRTKFLLRRFAHYLLTTMPQANAQQAIAMADRPLQLLLIETYGKFRDADAVEALIALSDHPETELREAARDALRQYFVGKAPRAKARRLKLPGGEESEHLQKLYLSYRERATHEIRQALERLTRGRYDRSIPGRELMRMLFEKQDRRRRTRWTRRLEEALEAFGNGEMDQALDTADEVLRGEPQLEGRARLFDIYATKAEQLTLEGRLAQAAALLERAASLLPRQGDDALGRQRRASLADASYLRALIQEARERPAQAIALHRQALAQWEEHVGARVALLHLAPEPRLDPQFLWTLLALAALGAPGLLLLLSALGRLRRREEPEDRP